MARSIDAQKLLVVSLVIVSYFLAIFLIDFYRLDHQLIGFFTELLTIPFLLAQIIFLIFGIKMLFSEKRQKVLILVSIIILALCSILTLGSFFK